MAAVTAQPGFLRFSIDTSLKITNIPKVLISNNITLFCFLQLRHNWIQTLHSNDFMSKSCTIKICMSSIIDLRKHFSLVKGPSFSTRSLFLLLTLHHFNLLNTCRVFQTKLCGTSETLRQFNIWAPSQHTKIRLVPTSSSYLLAA